jgi:hypothetical protein
MFYRDAQLLCTFAKNHDYGDTVDNLLEYYNVVDSKVYVLQNVELNNEIFLTFNAERKVGEFFPNTISVHRKKEYNIIYSINALNELVRQENDGVTSIHYQIQWYKYKNSFITARDGIVKITPTKLLKIFHIS